jgi:hypothetical protein
VSRPNRRPSPGEVGQMQEFAGFFLCLELLDAEEKLTQTYIVTVLAQFGIITWSAANEKESWDE